MKGKIIKPNEANKKEIVQTIILLILGIILVTNSNQIVTIAFQIIGALIITFGVYKIIRYISLKNQFKMEDTEMLTAGIITIAIGLILILIASVIEIGLRYLIGIYLIMNGISKLMISTNISMNNTKSNMIAAIIYIGLGLYTIFIANAAFVIIGILLIISSLFDIVTYFTNKKR